MSQQSSIQALDPFEMVVDTTIAGDSGVGNFKIDTSPTVGFSYRYKVDWGDGEISATTSSSDLTHTYPSGDTYTIKISGRFDSFRYDNSAEADKIISINSWGNIAWKSFYNSFYGASNLTGITSNPPNINSIANHNEPSETFFTVAFSNCTNLDADFGSWDMSNVTNMNSMFSNASSFNNGGSPSISGWTTSACTNMTLMFRNVPAFNQPIGSWDVSNVTTLDSMFQDAHAFNQAIGSWDVSNVTNMGNMFQSASQSNFNQDIGSWDVSNVTNMDSMLNNTSISIQNYDSILTGWTGWDGTGATKTLVSGVTFGAIGLNFTSGSTAEDARNYLITGLTWTITDAGGV